MIDELLQTLGKLALMRPLIRQDNEAAEHGDGVMGPPPMRRFRCSVFGRVSLPVAQIFLTGSGPFCAILRYVRLSTCPGWVSLPLWWISF